MTCIQKVPVGRSFPLIPFILRPSAPSLHSYRNQWGRNFKVHLPFNFLLRPAYQGPPAKTTLQWAYKKNLGCENRCTTVVVHAARIEYV